MILLDSSNPINWLAAHWDGVLGWAAVLTFLYKIFRAVDKALQPIRDLGEVKRDVALIKDNHLSHVQAELEKVNSNISGLREDIRDRFDGMREDIRLVLQRMP